MLKGNHFVLMSHSVAEAMEDFSLVFSLVTIWSMLLFMSYIKLEVFTHYICEAFFPNYHSEKKVKVTTKYKF